MTARAPHWSSSWKPTPKPKPKPKLLQYVQREIEDSHARDESRGSLAISIPPDGCVRRAVRWHTLRGEASALRCAAMPCRFGTRHKLARGGQ